MDKKIAVTGTITTVTINALEVTQQEDGQWRIVLPARALTQVEHETIIKLFPNLHDRVLGLLDAEALVSAIVPS